MMRVETAPYAVQTITKSFIDMRSPTSTALELVRNLPSVNIAVTDTSGLQGGRIQSRSLTDADMALMIDGGPAASAAYMAENVESEDVDSVSMMPGSSPIDLPVTSAAAGVLNQSTHVPQHKFGGTMDFAYGTNNLARQFIRLESGDVGNTGARGFVSFAHTRARSWFGGGRNEKIHVDVGVRKDWSNGSYARAFMGWNLEDFVVDRYGTASQFYDFKKTGNSYGRKSEYDPVGNDDWKNNINHWMQLFLTAPMHVVITKHLTLDLRSYYNWGRGWSGEAGGFSSATSGNTYKSGLPVATGTPLTSYFLQDGAFSVGTTAILGYDIDKHNHLELGYWYQKQDYTQHFPTSITNQDGANSSPNDPNYQIYRNGSRVFPGNTAGFEIHSLFFQDTAKYFNDHLLVNAGFKYVMSNVWYIVYPSRRQLGQNLTAPLPHVSVSYHFNEHHQFYVNAEGDFRQPSPSAVANTNIDGTLPKNQYSIREELGYRYNDKNFVVDLDFFNYNITNRLLSTYVGNNQTGVVNAGNQTARGVDLMVSMQPLYGFSPYVSFEYLNATTDTNIAASDVNGNLTAFRSKGKQAPLAPHFMTNFGLTYTYKGIFANGALHYTGPQSTTLAGDQRMPGYFTNTLSLGYHFKPVWYAKSPTIRLNFTNLTGAILRTGVVGVGTNASQVRLMNGNLSNTGSGAQFILEPRFTVTGTVSTAF
ncbi:TonB-dependent receptor [Gluconobacter oxydans]|uniref:TonB-dependent receptor n=1 Tax=Gluconobacter thailandicus TaxID=257438 RepID=UPI00029965B6|nr:TonB-dependent receptor [Gluconobacter thailandicus]AFW02531.1 tonB-dependent receptor plug [Gluconobacter oxydans H24]ANQ43090.1 TonB-dependent receptor [Gluconobacter oxydans]